MADNTKRLTDGARLWSTMMDIAAIGAIAGYGSCRVALTDEDTPQ
ncbi:MAG: hypothetical protein RLZZ366_798 [Pseudomonadota bacterium]|jgi:beta-ureidopropionase / N-carbamoyl-L-amino-acid hydrolase